MPIVLPPLPFQATPNESTRAPGSKPHLLFLHTWGVAPARTAAEAVARFEGTVAYLSRPDVEVSAHVVYGGTMIPAGKRRAVQQVRWERKAWTQAGANSYSYSIESADAIWTPATASEGGRTLDEPGLEQLARIAGYICLRSGIPPVWARTVNDSGLIRHRDGGPIANPSGHTDPTGSTILWRRFVRMVQAEMQRGGYRRSWGAGRWL